MKDLNKTLYKLKEEIKFEIEPLYIIKNRLVLGETFCKEEDMGYNKRVKVCRGSISSALVTYRPTLNDEGKPFVVNKTLAKELDDMMRWVLRVDDEFKHEFREFLIRYFGVEPKEVGYWDIRPKEDSRKFANSVIYCLLQDDCYGSQYMVEIIKRVIYVLHKETLDMPNFRYGDFELSIVLPKVIWFIKREEGCICRLTEEKENLVTYFERVKDFIMYRFKDDERTDLEINVMQLTLDYISKALCKYTIE